MAMSGLTRWMQGSRWRVLIAGCWLEATTGLSYVYSTYSPALKSQLSYDQRHISRLAVAKDLGDHIGLAAGFLCRVWPTWAVLLLGSLLILLGYGSLWLLTTHHIPTLPFWLVCIIVFLGTNGSTFLDTAALGKCIPIFPTNRGKVVGLLKGFKGLSGAIFNQIYASFLAPNEANFILLVAMGPAVIMVPLIFLMGPGHANTTLTDTHQDEDDITFRLLYAAALLLAAYMLTVTLLQDVYTVNISLNIVFTVILFLILLLPVPLPRIASHITKKHKGSACQLKTPLLGCDDCEGLDDSLTGKASGVVMGRGPQASYPHNLMEGIEGDSVVTPTDSRNTALGDRKTDAEDIWKIERAAAPDYTLQKAFQSLNFWLLVLSIFFSMGTGTTAFNNLSQMAQAQGYDNTEVFVSMSNIWNFMGRLVGGYVSELSTRDYGHPRTLVLALAQLIMAAGHVMFALALPGTIYIAVFLVAMGYGAEWAVFPTTLSELFGLQNFGVLYNCVSMASPAGSLIYLSYIAGPLYDSQARKQSGATSDDGTPLVCEGTICFELTFFIMAAVCVTGATVSIALTLRTRMLYSKN